MEQYVMWKGRVSECRKGSEIGVVNIDVSGSHGSKFQLKDGDADALRASGFVIRDDNVVEWVVIDGDQPKLLLG
jgi:hypothetical protein